jgi:hypothetical protein
MKNQQPDAAAQQLQALSGPQQAAYARTLLNSRTRRDTLRAALKVVRQAPEDSARRALHELYLHYGRANGAHDYGCYVRADILRALQPILSHEEAGILAGALRTYEFPPPQFQEEAALLRSVALVLFTELDDAAAPFHASRLLVDPHVDKMSGEPGVTAARVLAACGQTLALFQYVVEPRAGRPPEIAAECLRALTTLPARSVDDVLAVEGLADSAVRHVGVIDLLLRHDQGPLRVDWLLESLRKAPLEVFRYALFAIVAAGDDALLGRTVTALGGERNPERIAAAIEALDLVRLRPDVAALLSSPAYARRERHSRR